MKHHDLNLTDELAHARILGIRLQRPEAHWVDKDDPRRVEWRKHVAGVAKGAFLTAYAVFAESQPAAPREVMPSWFVSGEDKTLTEKAEKTREEPLSCLRESLEATDAIQKALELLIEDQRR